MLHRPRVGCQRDLKETLALDKVEPRGQTPASPGSPASIPEGPLHTQQHVALALSQESQRDAPWKDFPDVASNHGNTSADPVATVETGAEPHLHCPLSGGPSHPPLSLMVAQEWEVVRGAGCPVREAPPVGSSVVRRMLWGGPKSTLVRGNSRMPLE